MTRNEHILEETLDFVNAFRESIGVPTLAELPKGVKGSDTDCPVANAIGFPVGWQFIHGDGKTLDTLFPKPSFVKEFTRLFDDGQYPELVA